MTVIRVLIADDHAVLREGLASLINAQRDMEVVAQASDGLEALDKAASTEPDVAIIDLNMPRCGGAQTIERLRTRSPSTRALVLTMYDDQAHLRAVLAAGAAGYVVKRAAGKQLLSGIRQVHAGRSFINVRLSPSALQAVVDDDRAPEAKQHATLSRRELEVLRLLSYGFTNKQIAEQLEVSKKTVDTYRIRVADKLGLRTRADMVRYALDTGLMASDKQPDDTEP